MNIAVVGAGLTGISVAALLVDAGYRVTLIESAPVIGGVLSGIGWGNFTLDKGCHLFASDDELMLQTMNSLAPGLMQEVPVRVAAYCAGTLQQGSGLHFFTFLPESEKKQIRKEIIDCSNSVDTIDATTDAHSAITGRYGPTLAEHLSKCLEKQLQAKVDTLEWGSVIGPHLRRVFVFDDTMSAELKKDARVDEILASSAPPFREPNPFVYYPREGGTQAFVEETRRSLLSRGVNIRVATKVSGVSRSGAATVLRDSSGRAEEFERIVWSSGAEGLEKILFARSGLASLVHKVSMILYYFVVDADQILDFNFVADYDTRHVLARVSAPGKYGGQFLGGKTYVCCEVPESIGTTRWNSPEGYLEQVWSEAKEVGMLRGDMPRSPDEWKIVATPSSYRVTRVGYTEMRKVFDERVSREFPRITLVPDGTHLKADIATSVKALVKDIIQES